MKELKIAFAGLDNAGKTSFLIALRKKYNFQEFVKELLPTKLIEFNAFNFLNQYNVNIWDMGGQEKYRQLYVKNLVYFEETDFLYYIIDIQDESKFENTLDYLKKILAIYKDLEYNKEVIICFSKFDPKIKNDSVIQTRKHELIKLIREKNPELRFKFFETSYYDIASLSVAMSYSLNQTIKINALHEYIQSLGKKFQCQYVILYSETGLIISDYYGEIFDTKDFEERISIKMSDDLRFFQELIDNKQDFSERTSFFNDQKEFVKKFLIDTPRGKISFYLGLASNELKQIEVRREFNNFEKELLKAFMGNLIEK
ncbi:MAG: 50S ribosome-binding GTPase [Candidatus Lokiarchaeota archaeon]|nr:50S ribosome-binding GTPase [Candidatus Lokiarchaeota archaeon]